MFGEYQKAAQRGDAIWLGDLRQHFQDLPENRRVILRLTDLGGVTRDWEIFVPLWQSAEEGNFVREYLAACVFNLLSCFGGRELCFVFADSEEDLRALVSELETLFQLNETKRNGYGKVISISDRLCRAFGAEKICFSTADFTQDQPPTAVEERYPDDLGGRLCALAEAAKEKFCCGIDVGGTDIKAAVSLNGRLLFTWEYDWDPA